MLVRLDLQFFASVSLNLNVSVVTVKKYLYTLLLKKHKIQKENSNPSRLEFSFCRIFHLLPIGICYNRTYLRRLIRDVCQRCEILMLESKLGVLRWKKNGMS